MDRDRKSGGRVFGAFAPAAGEALTATYTSRPIVTLVDFLEKVKATPTRAGNSSSSRSTPPTRTSSSPGGRP